MKKEIHDYVYSVEAVRKRLARGAKSVWLFQPYTGFLFNVRTVNGARKVMKEVGCK